MKLDLLHDILRGLDELERREGQKLQHDKPKAKVYAGKVISVKRESNKDKASEPINVVKDRGMVEYDPMELTFIGIEPGSDEHHNKLRDLGAINRCNPYLAHKILTFE